MIFLQKLQRFFGWREQEGAGARRVTRDAVVEVDSLRFILLVMSVLFVTSFLCGRLVLRHQSPPYSRPEKVDLDFFE